MHPQLSPQKIQELEDLYITDRLSVENEVKQLIRQGYDKETAEKLITDIVNAQREKLFQKSFSKQKREENKEITLVVATMVSLIGPLFGITSILWYLVACVIAGVAGYFGYKNKPLAGIIASVIVVVLLPFTYNFYLAGRGSYLRIELLIPLAMAFIPAYLALTLISRSLYYDSED